MFPNGVSCHYHSGFEFITQDDRTQKPGKGELHCIVPSSEAQSPRVYGGHIECAKPPAGTVHDGHVSHEIHHGAICRAQILEAIMQCDSFRCCDEGTLTNPIATLITENRNDIRPDFRICQDTLKIDCDLIANYTAHPANCPALGGVGDPVFAVIPPSVQDP